MTRFGGPDKIYLIEYEYVRRFIGEKPGHDCGLTGGLTSLVCASNCRKERIGHMEGGIYEVAAGQPLHLAVMGNQRRDLLFFAIFAISAVKSTAGSAGDRPSLIVKEQHCQKSISHIIVGYASSFLRSSTLSVKCRIREPASLISALAVPAYSPMTGTRFSPSPAILVNPFCRALRQAGNSRRRKRQDR